MFLSIQETQSMELGTQKRWWNQLCNTAKVYCSIIVALSCESEQDESTSEITHVWPKNGAMKHEAKELRRGPGDSVPVSKPQCWTSIPWTRKGMESYSGTQPILIVLLVLATTVIIIMVWNLCCQSHKNTSMVPSLTNGSYNPLPFSIMLTCQMMKPLGQ
jgi:hypothetical protein